MAAQPDVKMEGPKEEKLETKEEAPEGTHRAGRKLATAGSEPPPAPLTEQNFREASLPVFEKLLEEHGGPVQYLATKLGSCPGPAWHRFARDLRDAFPPRADFAYLEGPSLPRESCYDATLSFKAHLWQLGWAGACSSKPPTYRVTAMSLLDEYLTNSVLTAGEPLLLYQSSEDTGAVDEDGNSMFFTHYVKGAARATSMLLLAHVFMYAFKCNLAFLKVDLYESLRAIYCRVAIAATDATSVALENARYSARGSIRKNPDAYGWAAKLMTLREKGLSPTEIIKQFNATATNQAQLQGGKKSAILNLLDLPPTSLTLLVSHVSQFGAEKAAFADGAFSNKKVLPGYTPRASADKEWQRRLTLTDEGVATCTSSTRGSRRS